ncbi:SGNH/GDSL hydrolase family protein [Flavobacterium sp. MK4S-17]|uniref:SGNH/GDSL hydrolase family protein n=1 Tax=Flavobacterium sp. MK4S-17 TaxID=2543737 RepID=UPI00135A791A|nr:SGNH/GDSL hydrolase family protein [Flavobacterium sp. MK4S-17]
MHYLQKLLLFFTASVFFTATVNDKNYYILLGRTEVLDNEKIALIGSAASVTFSFKGEECNVTLQTENSYEHHNFVSLELDGKYIGRLRITEKAKVYNIPVPKGLSVHKLSICKATEASVGTIVFHGAKAKLVHTQGATKPRKKIEFIGDSITCGMGADTEEIPCGTDEWYDQHNAYFAYGPVTARSLKAGYLLSSVSGIGMYRNWNDEHKEEPIMPDVYGKLYLNFKGNDTPYDFSFHPDVTCIALGTNDFSDGDGTKTRLPFNEDKYVSNCISFINMLLKHTPDTQIVLLNSPMVTGEKSEIFIKCLERVQQAFKGKSNKPVKIFKFTAVIPHGCTYHPDINDHKAMAAQLTPFLNSIMHEK